MERCNRQTGLPGFSNEEQEKLRKAKVLVVGAGGLGCPALLYLAAMGFGTIGIVDGDKVSITNLNRQVLYGEKDVGTLKAQTAAGYLQNKYNDIQVQHHSVFMSVQNALQIISNYDLVLDCTDNFSSRYLINDACALLHRPLIFGAIYEHEGQVMVFHPEVHPKLNYRHVYPNPPFPDEIPDCNATGVLGVLPGLIGVFMATEVVKMVSGFGEPLFNKIMYYNISDNSRFITEISVHPEGDTLLPLNESEFTSRDYSFNCTKAECISWEQVFDNLVSDNKDQLLVDVREDSEEPRIFSVPTVSFPLSEILQQGEKDLDAGTLYLFCQSGIRSKKAARLLKEKYPAKIIWSIEGGINSSQSPVNQN